MKPAELLNPRPRLADGDRVRSRFVMLVLMLVATACGQPSPSASDETTSTSAPPESTVATSTSTTTSTTTASTLPTTQPPDAPLSGSWREEWRIETVGGEITVLGEHTAEAARWIEIYGSDDPEAFYREVIAAGDQAWDHFAGEPWEPIDLDGVVNDLLNGHPFEIGDIIDAFELVGPGTHEGRDVITYAATGALVAGFTGVDPESIEEATATVSLYPDDTFAAYELYYERGVAEWARLTYRTYDLGASISIELPEVVPSVASCRDRGQQLIDEVGAYRSRYDLLHPGAAYSAIEELRTLDPWAWQLTVSFVADETAIETLWVDGGAQYWRTPGGDWKEDDAGLYLSLTYRPFVDDLWIPDVVEQFSPTGTAEVAGRMVDVYRLGLEDIRQINEGLASDTDTLEATLWIEPCSFPELVKLEVIATGPGYVESQFHVVYELFDLGTSDTIDIPLPGLEG